MATHAYDPPQPTLVGRAQPLVSVIIPAYNCSALTAEAVQSVVDQDYQAKEIIVINDGSTDDTSAVLKRFGDAIHVIEQINSGPPVARNAGVRKARGAYIAFLDADDVWFPHKLSRQVRYLETHPEAGGVYTAWRIWEPSSDGSFVRPSCIGGELDDDVVDQENSGWLYNRLLLRCLLLTTTVMLRASLVHRIGEFDLTLFNGDDYDYWIRASRLAEIHKLKGVGALYRNRSSSVSTTPQKRNFEYEVICKAIDRWGLVGPDGLESDRSTIDKRLRHLVFRHAYFHFWHGDPRLALGAFLRVLRDQPANPKLWAYAILAAAKALMPTGVRRALFERVVSRGPFPLPRG